MKTSTLLPCCGHRDDRHITIEPGNEHQGATTICLSANCRCGKPKLPKTQGKRVRPTNAQQGGAYREHHGKRDIPAKERP